jgi:WD40 repeat protein
LKDGDTLQFKAEPADVIYKFSMTPNAPMSCKKARLEKIAAPEKVPVSRRYKGRDYSALSVVIGLVVVVAKRKGGGKIDELRTGVELQRRTKGKHKIRKLPNPLLSLDKSILKHILGYLSRMSLQRTMSIEFEKDGHLKDITASSFSPDGTQIVTSSTDQTVKVWRAVDGMLLKTFEFSCYAMSCCFSPTNGNTILCGLWDGWVAVLDLITGERKTRMEHTEAVMSVQFSPDSTMYISTGFDRRVVLWDAVSCTRMKMHSAHADLVFTACFSPDSKLVLSGGQDKVLKLWDVETGTIRKTLASHGDAVMTCAFSPCGKRAISGSRDHAVIVWDIVKGCQLRALRGHSIGVHSCCYHPHKDMIVTGGYDANIVLWNPSTGERLTTLYGHQDWIRAVNFSPDGLFLVSGASDRSINLWLMKADASDVALL